LLFMAPGDEHAVVHDLAETARRRSGEWAVPFVNAVLRRAAGNRDSLLAWLDTQPLPVRLSHPDILVTRWRTRWPDDQVSRLCDWNNRPPRVVLRVHGARATVPDLVARLRATGLDAEPHRAGPGRFILLGPGAAVHRIPGYAEGHFIVQDPSADLAVSLLGARPGEAILDLCAAPGGKTAAIAEAMQGRGRLAAADSDPARLGRLQNTLERMRLDWVRVVQADATHAGQLSAAFGEEGFDRVLLDAPCTNTGVLRRRVEARWHFSEERLHNAAAKQRKLLDGAAGLVRPGGAVVYSTCSLEPEENHGLVSAWLRTRPDFELQETRGSVPPELERDGGYAARLVRRN
jgi:16S rRNA (cytosine967-C5)-methyltransferase